MRSNYESFACWNILELGEFTLSSDKYYIFIPYSQFQTLK